MHQNPKAARFAPRSTDQPASQAQGATQAHTQPSANHHVERKSTSQKPAEVETLGGTKRQPEFDVAKGVGILAVIIGHGAGTPTILRNLIFSFHMPLFFIISGFFMKPTQKLTWSFVKKQAKALLLPYVITSALVVAAVYLFWTSQGDGEMAIVSAKAFFRGSLVGMGENPAQAPLIPIIYFSYCAIGAIWFLWGLFWAKLILAALNTVKGKPIWLLAIWCLSIASTYWYYLPFSFQPGCCAALFLYIGQLIREKDILKKGALSLPTWILLGAFATCNWLFGDVIFAVGAVYSTPILNILGSTAATLVIIKLAQLILTKAPQALAPLDYIGQMTLALLCMHLVVLDVTYYPALKAFCGDNLWIFFILEAAYNLVMSFALVGVLWLLPKKLKRIFLPAKLYHISEKPPGE